MPFCVCADIIYLLRNEIITDSPPSQIKLNKNNAKVRVGNKVKLFLINLLKAFYWKVGSTIMETIFLLSHHLLLILCFVQSGMWVTLPSILTPVGRLAVPFTHLSIISTAVTSMHWSTPLYISIFMTETRPPYQLALANDKLI